MTQQVTLNGKASHSPSVFMTVQDEHQMVLTLSEHGPLPCSSRDHIPRVFLLPTELVEGLGTQWEEGEHQHLEAQAEEGKVLLHSGRISYCLQQVSHCRNLFLCSYVNWLLNTPGNSQMGTEENSQSKQRGDNVAQWLGTQSLEPGPLWALAATWLWARNFIFLFPHL